MLRGAGSADGQSGLRLLCAAQLYRHDIRVGGLQSARHHCSDHSGSHTVVGHICVHRDGGASGSQTVAAHLRCRRVRKSAGHGCTHVSEVEWLRYERIRLVARCGILIHDFHCLVGSADAALSGHLRDTASQDTQQSRHAAHVHTVALLDVHN